MAPARSGISCLKPCSSISICTTEQKGDANPPDLTTEREVYGEGRVEGRVPSR